MNEILITKIIFGVFLTLGGLVLIVLAFAIFYKYLIQEKRCTSKTEGTIKKYTIANYNGIHLPVVYYEVSGKEYKVKGPEYKWIITKTKSTPFSKNKMEYQEKNQNLIIDRSVNSNFQIYKNPVQQLYPINSKIDVFYDPNNPKLSYVLKYCNKKIFFWIMLITGILVLIIDFLILICL